MQSEVKSNLLVPVQTMVQCHPMRIVLVVLICTTWEMCFTFSKQIPDQRNVIDIAFTKCEAYLPCGTNQNNQDNTHGMALYRSLCTVQVRIFIHLRWCYSDSQGLPGYAWIRKLSMTIFWLLTHVSIHFTTPRVLLGHCFLRKWVAKTFNYYGMTMPRYVPNQK